MSADCIFCQIANHQVPVEAVFEDDRVIAFPDINPVAPIHVLVVPKKHVQNLLEANDDKELLGHIMGIIPLVAQKLGLEKDGFRVVINTKDNGGQTVPHLHFHILGGRFMTWPPG